MKTLFKILLTVSSILIIAILIAYNFAPRTPNNITPQTNTVFYGYIEGGEKFGVAIGFTAEQARAVFEEQDIFYAGRYNCAKDLSELNLLVSCDAIQEFDLYRIKAVWRQGFIYVEIHNDAVQAIIWDLNFLPHVDL